MKLAWLLLPLSLGACATPSARNAAPVDAPVEAWVTTADQSALLAPQPHEAMAAADGASAITVDADTRYQSIVGFGAAVTDASAYLLQQKIGAAQRDALLKELFGTGEGGLGFSFTRVTIGASDFSRTHYSYDDMPKGETDPSLARFSIAPARAEVLPTVRAALAINPDLAVMASPWSAPGWMKSTDSLIKGTLREEAYAPFAAYLRRTVEDYRAVGVPVQYLSIQNEPDFEPENYPGMRLSPAQRARIIGDHVGPAFRAAGLDTKILEWDHNWDKPEQPLGVLADEKARAHIDGVAWHCYAGDVAAQAPVRERYPDKNVYFTECSGGEWSKAWPDAWSWMVKNLVIGATRNWARGVLLWNLALDEKYGPHLGGCGDCRGVVTIDSNTGAVTRNVEYYALGHLSRFVRRGAHRVASSGGALGVESVAFVNPDGSRVLLAFNAGKAPADVAVSADGRRFGYRLPVNAAITFRWRGAP